MLEHLLKGTLSHCFSVAGKNLLGQSLSERVARAAGIVRSCRLLLRIEVEDCSSNSAQMHCFRFSESARLEAPLIPK